MEVYHMKKKDISLIMQNKKWIYLFWFFPSIHILYCFFPNENNILNFEMANLQ